MGLEIEAELEAEFDQNWTFANEKKKQIAACSRLQGRPGEIWTKVS